MDHDYHSRICTAPGVLTICGQNVRSIFWSTWSPESDAALFQALDPAQAGSLCLSHGGFTALLEGIKTLFVTKMSIQTDTRRCDMEVYTGRISVTLSDGQVFSCTAMPAARGEVARIADTALYLLEAASVQSLERKLLKMPLLGMAALPPEWSPGSFPLIH